MNRFKDSLFNEYQKKEAERDQQYQKQQISFDKIEERYNSALIKCNQLTEFIDTQIAKIATNSMTIEKLTESNKKLKDKVKVGIQTLKENFEKNTLESDSKIEILKTTLHNELDGIKNNLFDVPTFERTQMLINHAIANIKFPEPPRPQTIQISQSNNSRSSSNSSTSRSV